FVPALLSSDEDMGINSNASMIVEFTELQHTPISKVSGSITRPKSTDLARNLSPRVDTPLTGSVDRTTHGDSVMKLVRGAVAFAPQQDTV
ncbi:hypothetical protein, partial [Listeria monocytogenes]|uniref:hypothetical protein n=1 Tax=Listeria monocytogenes TaxID=1639 RepID=UPI003FA4BE77